MSIDEVVDLDFECL